VDVSKDLLVGDLKDRIKTKKAPRFDDIAADELVLWKVNIPGDREEMLRNLVFEDREVDGIMEMLAMKKIGKYFLNSPEDERIHVIVQPQIGKVVKRKLNCFVLSIFYYRYHISQIFYSLLALYYISTRDSTFFFRRSTSSSLEGLRRRIG